MNDEQLKNFIAQAREIAMTPAEKEMIRGRLVAHIESFGATVSPYSQVGPIYISRKMSYVLASALIFLMAFSGTAHAAEASLPGDLLYPVKVKAIEPLEGVLSFDPQAKADWSSGVAIERLDEAQALASQGRLDATTSAELAQSFASSSDTFSKTIASLLKKNPRAASSSEAVFNAEVRSHAESFASAIQAMNASSTKNLGLSVIENSISERFGITATSTTQKTKSPQSHKDKPQENPASPINHIDTQPSKIIDTIQHSAASTDEPNASGHASLSASVAAPPTSPAAVPSVVHETTEHIENATHDLLGH